jgi:DNA polymerase III epsilon subunit-like protein
MKYVSIDIETTGLNPETCQVIEFGAVIEDTNTNTPLNELPSFHRYVQHDSYCGEAYALSMHQKIFERIAKKPDGFNYCKPNHLLTQFDNWLEDNKVVGKINVAGKNFAAFDLQFLKKLNWFDQLSLSHRFIDPAMLYVDFRHDGGVPNLQTCLDRAGISETVAHTAVEDALSVINLIRHYNRY